MPTGRVLWQKRLFPEAMPGGRTAWGMGLARAKRVRESNRPSPALGSIPELMNWYYVHAGKQAGPVDDAGLEQLRRVGTVQLDTLIWREGMAEWRPFGEVKPELVPAALPEPVAPPVAVPPGSVVCAECGQVFDINDTIPYGTVRVCAGCKPVFMQKLSEGVRVDAGFIRYAGFWVRFGAKFIDSLLLRVVVYPISFGLGLVLGLVGGPGQSTITLAYVVGGLVGLSVALGYNVFFLGKFSATPGKMACKLKVISADGRPLSYRRAALRFLAELLSSCPTLFIGYIMAGPDEEKRALHDRLCNTRVVYK